MDNKAIAAKIVAANPADTEGEIYEGEVAEEADEDGLNYAAEDIIAAFEAKDPGMMKDAIRNFVEMCK